MSVELEIDGNKEDSPEEKDSVWEKEKRRSKNRIKAVEFRNKILGK